MKRYRLKQELPTFKAGELFHTDENGNLWRDKGQKGKHWQDEVMAYHHKTIERFPNILTDWFEEYEERDPLSKEAFIEYLRANPEQRLMQAVCSFADQKLDPNIAGLMVRHTGNGPEEDTWNWECDQMMLEARQQEIEEPEFTTFEAIEKRKKLEQMKKQLREWAEKNDITQIQIFFDGDEIVRFRELGDYGENFIEIKGWPRDELHHCGEYGINYLLDKANKE